MSSLKTQNPYELTTDKIIPPPVGWKERIKFLGPGFILSASIVGSGELIATTRLGAQAGFVTFWVIIVSCLVKVAVQLEFGKHAIYTGETTFEGYNKLPGPKIGKANWSIWTWLLLMTLKFLQLGGIVGGCALVLNIAFPAVPVWLLCLLIAVAVSLLIYKGYYHSLERISIVMIVLFTILTLVSVIFMQYTEFAVSSAELWEGMSFQLPPEAVVFALGAFGITGVGGDEIMAYNYWLIEKGYAANTGPREDSEEWRSRAKEWIKVMYMDAILSMIVYTLMTAAFYLLGAGILHRQGLVPEGMQLIETLSQLYTESLGPSARVIFLVAAFVVLFSTLFGALAMWTRLFPDAFGQIGWINFRDPTQRKRTIAILAWTFPILWTILFLVMKTPAMMVIIGGVITSVILLIVVLAALHFRYRRLPAFLKPSRVYDLIFWLSVIAIAAVGIYSLYKVV